MPVLLASGYIALALPQTTGHGEYTRALNLAPALKEYKEASKNENLL